MTLSIQMPFHSKICKGMSQLRDNLQRNLDMLLRGVLSNVKIEVSYKNGGSPLHVLLRQVNCA